MTRAARPTEMTSMMGRCCRNALIRRCRMPTSALGPAAVKDYSQLFRLSAGDATPL